MFDSGEDEVLYMSMSRVPMDNEEKEDMPLVVNKASAVYGESKLFPVWLWNSFYPLD